MRFAGWVGAGVLLLAGAALAAQGDALRVTASNVNVRAGPGTDAGILTRVGADEPAIEQRRQGEWVEVELPNQNVLGWIHGSLLGKAAAAGQGQGKQPPLPSGRVSQVAAHAPSADELPDAEPDGTPLGQFRREVEYFNTRAVAAAGIDLFTDVEPLEDGGVQVVATDAWATMPRQGQQSYVNALYGRWQAIAGTDQALRLEIVDENGALMMEKSAP